MNVRTKFDLGDEVFVYDEDGAGPQGHGQVQAIKIVKWYQYYKIAGVKGWWPESGLRLFSEAR